MLLSFNIGGLCCIISAILAEYDENGTLKSLLTLTFLLGKLGVTWTFGNLYIYTSGTDLFKIKYPKCFIRIYWTSFGQSSICVRQNIFFLICLTNIWWLLNNASFGTFWAKIGHSFRPWHFFKDLWNLGGYLRHIRSYSSPALWSPPLPPTVGPNKY